MRAVLPVRTAAALVLSGSAAVAAESPDVPPATPPSSSISSPAPSSPPVRFDVMEYQVEGNTLLSVLEVEDAVYPYLGPERTAEDVEKARAALETAYSRKGYPTVTAEIPEQSAASEVITLRVVERPVGRLRVKGARYFLPSEIKAAAPALAEGTVPNFQATERQIVDLNLQPDRRVTPVLKAGAAPGTVDVDLLVEDKLPLHGALELNNRKSQDTEPLRLVASLRYDNLWQRGDSINFSYQVAPQRPDDAQVYSGSYLARVPDSRLSFLVYGLKSDSNVATVGGTNVVGKGEVVGGRAILPVTIEAGFVQSVSGGVDYKDFGENVLLGDDQTKAPVTYYPFTVGWGGNWSGETARTEAGANVVFTFAGLGSNSDDFDTKRFDADPSFILLQANAARTQDLPADLQLWGSVQAQAAGQPLISNEQFSLGGLDSVRGYLESEALGDYGASVQTEFRSPELTSWASPYLTQLRFHAFVDAGAVGIHKPLPGQDSTFQLSSIGVGARAKVLDHVGGTVDVAVPLLDGPDTDQGHVRTIFRAFGEF